MMRRFLIRDRRPLQVLFSTRKYSTKQICIVGATIEGLTTALSLQRFSKTKPVRIQIIDSRENVNDMKGESVIITPAASHILQDLNLLNRVKEQGNVIGHYIILNNKNKIWLERDLSNSPSPYIAISYVRLHKILTDALSKIANILYEHNPKEVEQENDKYIIKFQRSSFRPDINADILVGADGASSIIREKFFSDSVITDEHVGANYNYLIINTPTEVDFENRVFEYWGNTSRFVIIPINKRQLGIISAFRDLEIRKERRGKAVITTAVQVHKDLAKLDAPSYILKYLNKIDSSSELRLPPFVETVGRSPKRVFVKDDVHEGVVLVGEAAHSVDPVMWQVPTVAIQDGYELGKCLADKDDLRQGLSQYKNKRKYEVNDIEKASKYFTKQFTKMSHPLIDWYRSLKMILGQRFIMRSKLRKLQ